MSKELKFEFNDYIIAIDEPYENDCGYVAIGKKDTKDNINIYFKSLNQQTVDFYIELQKHIADLEAKLAEMQEIRDFYLKRYEKKLKEYDKENKQLKQQLAEKEKEVQQWKSMAERSSSMLDRFNYCRESIVYNTTREQDKISFAVEQLEKMKDFLHSGYAVDNAEIEKEIDNQIEELKKGL